MVRTVGKIILFLSLIAPSLALAEDACDAVLKGARNIRVIDSQEQFIQDTINWSKSQRFGTETQARDMSANFGITIPIEGIPVNFTSAYNNKEFGSKTWGEAFAEYLEKHTQEARRYYEAVQQQDPGSVRAWSECMQTVNTKAGLHCWAYPTDNPQEFGLTIKFVPERSKINEITISKILAENLTPSVNLIGRKVFLQESQFSVRRQSNDPSRIEISAGVEHCIARVAPVILPEHPAPCTKTVAGKCKACRFSVSDDTPGGQKFEKKNVNQFTQYLCSNMAASSKLRIRMNGSIQIDGSGPPHSYQVALGLTGCSGGAIPEKLAKSAMQEATTGNFAVLLGAQVESTSSNMGACQINLIYILEDTNELKSVNGRTLTALAGTTIEVEALD